MHTQQETQHASPAILKTHEKGNTPCHMSAKTKTLQQMTTANFKK